MINIRWRDIVCEVQFHIGECYDAKNGIGDYAPKDGESSSHEAYKIARKFKDNFSKVAYRTIIELKGSGELKHIDYKLLPPRAWVKHVAKENEENAVKEKTKESLPALKKYKSDGGMAVL